MIFFLIYVDDILITGNDYKGITTLLSLLNQEFPTRDLGIAYFFLGIEIIPHEDDYLLSQSKYITGLLQRAKIDGARPVSTPIAINNSPSSSSPALSDPQIYRIIVGALQYVTITCPDITFMVNHAC